MRGLGESISVYIIVDDDAVGDSLAALLEPEGFFIRSYMSINRFLEGFQRDAPGKGGPACLLLDLAMPGRGDLDLLAVPAAEGRGLPVVVMTGTLDERTKSRALAGGAVAFLEKPVDADHLIDALRNACATGMSG